MIFDKPPFIVQATFLGEFGDIGSGCRILSQCISAFKLSPIMTSLFFSSEGKKIAFFAECPWHSPSYQNENQNHLYWYCSATTTFEIWNKAFSWRLSLAWSCSVVQVTSRHLLTTLARFVPSFTNYLSHCQQL